MIFSEDGVSPDPKKVEDMKKSVEPKNVSELRLFLGMAEYSARFIPDFATVIEPLRILSKKETEWVLGKPQMRAFREVKDRLAECATTAYFEVGKDIEVVVDASPVGLAALLVQEGRIMSYASISLSDVETRYSQTEREALAIVLGCEHFDQFINGAPRVTVITDHKPLENIWKNPKPPLRIKRWGLLLQPYKVQIVYRLGSRNPAD